ncbi:MAG: hypothetical protein NT154_34045, partial [Verrucomicrobia bacterium]|nr:hypothetical protein [Verrucomicrobiota bacterium]
MKTIISASILCCVAVLCASAQPLQTGTTASAAPVSSAAAIAAMPVTADGYSLTEVGPDSRRWSRVTALAGAHGELRYVTNSYVELQDCMYYIRQGPTGPEWAESKAEIEGFPGGAVARQGWIQMIFANDLATPGAIDAQTPAGRFRSHVLGLCYADSSLQTNIWIAEVKSCQGQIISSNQVLYPDALVGDGFAAGVRYTLGISGWEQDVLINDPAAMMAPETYGLDSSSPTLTLQAITEFVDSAVPTQTSRTVTTAEGAVFQDEDIDWGSLKLEHGKAFFLGQNPDAKGIPVNKRWVEVNSRHLLVEEMPFSSLMKALLSKGQGGSLKPGAKSNRQLASLKGLPVLPPAKRDPKPMQVAAAPPGQTGFLLDYQATLNSTRNNFVFAADTTYYVPGTSGAVNLNGTTTLEAGTVIKFASTNTANLLVNGPLICQSGPYRMAYLTSKHDTSVGETISGASGNPTNTGTIYFDAAASQTNAYSYLRVAYAATALRGPNFSNGVSHCQFVQCGTAVNSTSNQPVALRNVLLAQCTNAVVTTGTFTGEHLTVDQCSTLLSGAGSSGNLTNCLLTAVSTLGNVTRYASPNLAASNGVFQSVGAANYYLVNGSTNRQAGLTNINAALAANLRKLTTYPPAVLTNDFTVSTTLSPQALRDYSAGDLGYHYCPLDYLWTSLNLTNATLTLTNGVAVGFYGRNALYLRAGAQLVSEGGPVNLNRLVRSGLVQEQPVLAGASAVAHLEIGGSYSPRPVIQLRFTDLPAAGGSGLAASYYLSGGYYPIERVTLRDCWLRGGKLSLLPAGGSAVTLGVTNNLVERGIIEFKHASGAENTPLSLYLFNNLFW